MFIVNVVLYYYPCISVFLAYWSSFSSMGWIISISEQTFPLFVSDSDTKLVAGYSYLSLCCFQKIVVIYC